MIDDEGVERLLRINERLFELCKSLNDRNDVETASRLIPIVDELTRVLITVTDSH
jgi:hypothetical protein